MRVMKVKCSVCGNVVDYDPNNPYCPVCGAILTPPSAQQTPLQPSPTPQQPPAPAAQPMPSAPTAQPTPPPPAQPPSAAGGVAVVYAVMPNGDRREVLQLSPGAERVLGRSDLSSYAWRDPDTISRAHLKIKFDGAKVYVADDGSTNGTYVDGNDIRKKGYIEVPSGKEIVLVNPTRPVVKLVVEVK